MVPKKKPKYANVKIKVELAKEIDKFIDKSPVYFTRVDVIKKALDDLLSKE